MITSVKRTAERYVTVGLWSGLASLLITLLVMTFMFLSIGGVPDLEWLTWWAVSVTLLPVCYSRVAGTINGNP